MKYKLLSYNSQEDYYNCENEDGKKIKIDMFRDSSFKGFGNLTRKQDFEKTYKSFVGKTVEIKEIFPYIPFYFAKNVKLLK